MSRGRRSERRLSLLKLTEVASSSSPYFFQTITSELLHARKDWFKKYLKKVFFGVHSKATLPRKADRNSLGLVAG